VSESLAIAAAAISAAAAKAAAAIAPPVPLPAAAVPDAAAVAWGAVVVPLLVKLVPSFISTVTPFSAAKPVVPVVMLKTNIPRTIVASNFFICSFSLEIFLIDQKTSLIYINLYIFLSLGNCYESYTCQLLCKYI
jgi:hypothetical protein